MNPDYYIELALNEAKKAGNEIPVGCVIEKNGEILAISHNKKEELNDVSAHAEILALKEASKKLNERKLFDCNLYVTLEPCPMCAWAILNSFIKNVYFGAYDIQYGAFGSRINLSEISLNKIKVYGGIKEIECQKVLDDFFLKLRNKKSDN